MTDADDARHDLYFRLSGSFPGTVSAWAGEELVIRFSSTTTVTISATASEPRAPENVVHMDRLVAESSVTAPKAWIELLDGIHAGRWPPGFREGVPNNYLFDSYPSKLQDRCLAETDRLQRLARDAFGLMRWRWLDEMPKGSSFRGSDYEWSTDRAEWKRLRLRPRVRGTLGTNLHLSDHVRDTVQALADANLREPAGRDIWQVAARADPRTAVILAVTAVEVEVKQLISQAVPAATWLVTEAPTPPIVKIIGRYLPTVVSIPEGLAPPKRLTRKLGDAVQLRNSFVHSGPRESGWLELAEEDAEEIVEVASDLLWLFDIYRGHRWAAEYLSEATKDELQLP